jgi:hypothetical protein
MLYWYPTCDPAAATIELSLLSETMLTGQDVSHVRIEGLVFDCARFNGIELKASSDCIIAGCTVRRMAGNGISILGGQRDLLIGCDLHTMGRRASEVIGGERETLTPGGHVVANCRFRDFGRIDRTYTPAIQLEGVGNRVAHNRFLDCPSSVMRLEGNDHLVEYNECGNPMTRAPWNCSAIPPTVAWCSASIASRVSARRMSPPVPMARRASASTTPSAACWCTGTSSIAPQPAVSAGCRSIPAATT